jgi:asparagine synthase (glutamine-hydrolysing)
MSLLAETVELHMIADVPVGVLLSGGVDSTAVLSLAAEKDGQGNQQLHGRLFGFQLLPTRDPTPSWLPKLLAPASRHDHHCQRFCGIPAAIRLAHGRAGL